MSSNLVELIRRTTGRCARTALQVLKEAVEDHGEITDEDRLRAAEVSGLPEAAVYGVSTFYDDLLAAARARGTCASAPAPPASPPTGGAHIARARRGALGLGLGERSADGSISLAETVCLGFCHSSPAFRDGDVIDAGAGALERVLAGETRAAAEPEWRQRAGRAGADRARATGPGLARALAELDARGAARRRSRRPSVRGRGGAGFPAGRQVGLRTPRRRASRSSSSPTATRATPAPTSTST